MFFVFRKTQRSPERRVVKTENRTKPKKSLRGTRRRGTKKSKNQQSPYPQTREAGRTDALGLVCFEMISLKNIDATLISRPNLNGIDWLKSSLTHFSPRSPFLSFWNRALSRDFVRISAMFSSPGIFLIWILPRAIFSVTNFFILFKWRVLDGFLRVSVKSMTAWLSSWIGIGDLEP